MKYCRGAHGLMVNETEMELVNQVQIRAEAFWDHYIRFEKACMNLFFPLAKCKWHERLYFLTFLKEWINNRVD